MKRISIIVCGLLGSAVHASQSSSAHLMKPDSSSSSSSQDTQANNENSALMGAIRTGIGALRPPKKDTPHPKCNNLDEEMKSMMATMVHHFSGRVRIQNDTNWDDDEENLGKEESNTFPPESGSLSDHLKAAMERRREEMKLDSMSADDVKRVEQERLKDKQKAEEKLQGEGHPPKIRQRTSRSGGLVIPPPAPSQQGKSTGGAAQSSSSSTSTNTQEIVRTNEQPAQTSSSATTSTSTSSASHLVVQQPQEPKVQTSYASIPIVLDTRLHKAVKSNKVSQCKELLEQKVEINCRDEDGNTPLHLACQYGFTEIVSFLLSQGASHAVVNTKGWSPLHCAAVHDDSDLCELLLLKKADIDAQTLKTGDTPLHIASQKGNARACIYFLNAKASKKIKNYNGKTAFDCAFEHEDISIARVFNPHSLGPIVRKTIQANRPVLLGRLLLQSKNLHDDLKFADGSTALHAACVVDTKENDLFEGLVAGDAKVQATKVSIESGILQRQMILALIEKGGMAADEQDTFGRTPLHIAVEWGQEVACMTLLDKNADLTKTVTHFQNPSRVFTPLTLSAMYDHESIMRLLLDSYILKYGAPKLSEIFVELMDAALEYNSESVVKLLLNYKKRYQVTIPESGYYPLHKACYKGNLVICKQLLNDRAGDYHNQKLPVGIKPAWLPVEDSLTPLHCAALGGHADVCALLLRKKANPDSISAKGLTPLVYACQKGHREVIEFLLSPQVNADISVEALDNAASLDLWNCIFESITQRFEAIPHDERGENEFSQSMSGIFTTQDKAGKTLLHREAEKGNYEKCDLLLNLWADLTIVDGQGRTPLHLICLLDTDPEKLMRHNHLKTLEAILEDDYVDEAYLNKKDSTGATALHYALKGGKKSLIAVAKLLEAGADADITFNGDPLKSPRNIALASGIQELIEVFNKYSAH